MSNFYLLQKVRIVAGVGKLGRSNIGKEGFINELNCLGGQGHIGYGVTIDGNDSWHYEEHELEPLNRRPDKQQSSSDEMPADTLQVVSVLLSKIARVGEVANV